MIWLLLLSATAFAQPHWNSIAGSDDGFQYFRYGDGTAVEQAQFERQPFLRFIFHFWAPPAPVRTVCAIENRPGVFWYTPDGRPLSHTFPTPSPGEFTVSALETGIRGFGVTAAFAGSAKSVGAVEVAYFADRACSDGTVEYGFSRDLATDSILVYWSTFANCGNDAASLCRKTDDGSLGKGYSNVRQEDGGAAASHGFRIYGLPYDRVLSYQMKVERDGFRIEVGDGIALTQCRESPGGKASPCSFFKKVEPWFPLDRIGSGYIITGTQSAGDPRIEPGTSFVVNDIMVAK